MGYYDDLQGTTYDQRLASQASGLPANRGRGDDTMPLGNAVGALWHNYGPYETKENGVDTIRFGRRPVPDAPYAEDAPGAGRGLSTAPYAEDAPSRGVTAPTAAPKPTAPGNDIQGWALRNNPNPRAFQAPIGGLQNNSGDQYNQMAQMLSGQSQQRVLGSAEDNMRQLANIRALNAQTPVGGVGILGEGWAEAQNAEKTQRWANENMLREAQNNPHLQHTIGAIIQANNSNTINERNVNERMAELGLQGAHQLAGYDMQGRNQLALEGLRGQNQLTGYGMQGQNQLANTLLGESLRGQHQLGADERRYELEIGKLGLQHAYDAPLHEAMMQNYQGNAEVNRARAAKENYDLEQGKLPHAQVLAELKQLGDMYRVDPTDPWVRKEMARREIMLERIWKEAEARSNGGREAKANGGLVGYADGGAVDPIEEAYRRAGVQRPQQFRDQAQQQAQRPVQVSAPQAAPAPQREETWTEKARRIATGGLDRRMNGYADGGWVNEPDGSRYRMVNGVKNIEDPNGPKWGGYGTTGINPLDASGGYGSFTNSRGTTYGNGGLSATPTAGQNWNNAGGAGPNSWSAPRDQGFASLPTAQPSYSPPTTGLRQNATMQPDRSWMSANERQTLDSFNQRMNGYARGGPIDVSGRQVLGDGTGKSDSIPAVIDGEREAGLSTGEFVMPVETVQHFGLDRLNKMVAQSRKGLDTGDRYPKKA